ncbi:MAG: hypothetical protein A2Y38_12750, partial [Spirochaetes bacterium GWB1_59_5]
MIQITNKETGEVKNYSDAEFEAERTRLLMAWETAKTALEAAKETEMKLRKEFVAFAFDPNKDKGTERIELGNGWQAKAVKKINFGWIKDGEKVNKHAIDDALDMIEKTVANGSLIAERLVKWTPELSQTEYKLLDEKAKSIIDAVIVTSEGTPTLEIIAPKAK